MKKSWISTVLALLILFLAAGEARAGVLLASSRQTFTTPVTTTVSALPLDDSGSTSLSFSTGSTQTVVITYSTDCQISTIGSALAVVIYVDGVAAAGTGAGSAGSRLCSSDGMSANSRTAFITVSAGSHTLQITGQILGSGTGTLRRTVTTVMN